MPSDLNANIMEPEGTPYGEAIVDELAEEGLEEMGLHISHGVSRGCRICEPGA